MTDSELRDLRVPLGAGHAANPEEPVTVEDLHSFLEQAERRPGGNSGRQRCFRCLEGVTFLAVVCAITLLSVVLVRFVVAHFDAIWHNGFVAALLLGGLAFVLQRMALWVALNVFARFFMTTIKLSKEGKEATPVLEWFKVWLPKMMKENGHNFRSVQPLFRKKDGSTFLAFFRDIRSRDKFELISWVMPGTHVFTYRSRALGGSIRVMMHYWTGEAKKEGWDQSLTVMETVVLTVFDPYNQALPYLMEMLTEAQQRFAERDLDCLRFQEWHGWKQMWESTTPDERIAPNFKTLAFYPQALLSKVELEVDQFLNTPEEVLLRAGLPLKLGFLFHGPPGTGKTNLVRYLAAKYRLPINIVDCNSGHMDNIQLLHAVVSAEGIVLFEDIDNLDAACGRVRESLGLVGNKAQVNKSVTLDGLLNALDGVHRGTQKRILVATTNYPEKLIPSIRRRGRFGFSLQVDYPQDEELEAMFRYYSPSLPAKPTIEGLRAVEKRTGLRLSTAAAVDIIAKSSLQQRGLNIEVAEAAEGLVRQAELALQELQQSNRKRLSGTFELLELLRLERYAGNFFRAGFFDMRYVKLLGDGELDKIGVSSMGDRKKILDALQFMEDTPPLVGLELDKAREGLRAMCCSEVVAFSGLAGLLRSVFPDEDRAKEVENEFLEQGFSDVTVKELKMLKDKDVESLGIKKVGEVKRFMSLVNRLDDD